MLIAVLIVVCVIAITASLRVTMARPSVKAANQMASDVEDEIEKRLRSIPAAHNGSIVAGPALETLQGKLVLAASKAPKSFVVDCARFSAPVPGTQQLTVARVEEAKKIISTKGLKALTPEDPELAKSYLFWAMDETLGRRCMEPAFVDILRRMDEAVRGRCRLTLARGTATVWLERGLAKPEEIAAFYDGSVALIAALRERLGA